MLIISCIYLSLSLRQSKRLLPASAPSFFSPAHRRTLMCEASYTIFMALRILVRRGTIAKGSFLILRQRIYTLLSAGYT